MASISRQSQRWSNRVVETFAVITLIACADTEAVMEPQRASDASYSVGGYAGTIFGEASDPLGDALVQPPFIPPDLVHASIAVVNGEVILKAQYAPGVVAGQNNLFGFVIDTDQNPATPVTFPYFDLGVEVYIQNFFTGDATIVRLSRSGFTAFYPVTYNANALEIRIPLSAFNDDGIFAFRLLASNVFNIQDDLPNGNLPAPTTRVLTSADAVILIGNELASLVTQGVLTADQAAGLSDKLAAISASLARQSTVSACKQLNAFTSQVDAFVSNGTLPQNVGADLLGAAAQIAVDIGC